MVWPKIFTTYSQFHEDIILAALFENKSDGFYVDVGANDEEYHSVTKYFYKKGWHGINIEPIPRLYKKLAKRRLRDINLNCAVSSKGGILKFREYPNHDGLSTFNERAKREYEKLGFPFKDYDVKVVKLSTIFKEHNVEGIDFLKVDVEGYEGEVLRSNDWTKYRPAVICIEANHRDNDWHTVLKSQGYSCFIFDGLNEYYIADEHSGIVDGFAERATILSHNAIKVQHRKLWSNDIKTVERLRKHIAWQDTEIARLKELEENVKSIKYLTRQELKQLARRLGIKSRS